MASMSVTVLPYAIRVSVATPNGAGDPTWSAFALDGRLKFREALLSSSPAGPSTAKLSAATGEPASAQVDVEASAMIGKGDRVTISQGASTFFAGYMVTGELDVEANREGLLYRLVGPEWIWGPGSGRHGGSHRPVYGQWRRTAAADDAWAADPTGVTTAALDQVFVPEELTVFNPLGRKNMTAHDVVLEGGVNGRIFDAPDRKIGGVERAAHWTKLHAAKYLVQLFNDASASGITADWPAIETGQPGLATAVVRSVDVTGLSLYDALRLVLGPEYYFEVTCDPTSATAWGGFELFVHKYGSGPAASFTLDARGTQMHLAAGDVVRLGAMKSIDKSCTQVRLVGRAVRHVRLRYHGFNTTTIGAAEKKLSLQHGWAKGEGDLNQYVATTPAGINDHIEYYGIEAAGATLMDQWRARYNTSGAEHDKYRHVFRLFTWNEGGELRNGAGDAADLKPHYNATAGGAGTALAWYAPDLAEICDAKGFVTDPVYATDYAGKYARKPRRPLDTSFVDGRLDSWRRVKPTLWMAAQGENSATEPAIADYVRVPTSYYRVDEERCAVWITADDLVEWRPLINRQDKGEANAMDGRNFATLLYMGKLRMILELSVEVDQGMHLRADRGGGAGGPHVRSAVVLGQQDYVKSLTYADGLTSPSGLTAATLDMAADAQLTADALRDAAQDEQIHASVLASADSARQPIGSMILATAGTRVVSLTSSAGIGAQIVAVRVDPVANKWEYLTESAALEIRAMDRARVVARRRHRVRGRSPIPNA